MNVKKVLALVLALLLLFSIPACNKGKDEDKTKEPGKTDESKQPGETEGDLSILELNGNKVFIWAGMYEIVDETFARNNPEIELEHEDVVGPFQPDKTEDLQRLGAAIATGDQPDLLECRMTPPEAYYSNMFDPIQPYLEVDPKFNIKDIDPGILDVTTFNDVIYFLPTSYSSNIFVWNKELFEQVGLDPEKPPETWDEVKEYSERLKTTDSTGKYATVGIIPGTDLFNAYNWDHTQLAAFGQDGHYIDETRLNFRWDTPEFLETFEFTRDLQNIYGGKKMLPADNFNFFQRKTGMIHWNGTSLPVLYTLGATFDYGFTYMPRRDKDSELYVSGHIGAAYGIPKGAKNPAGGWLYVVNRLTDAFFEEAVDRYSVDPNGWIPAYSFHKPTRDRIINEFEPILDPELVEIMKKRDEIESKRNVAYYTSPVEGKLMTYFNEQYNKFLDNEIAAKDFLSGLQSYADILIKEFKEQKIEEGWTFEEGKDGIPPEDK